MKRLVLYVTDQQLRTILPVVINDCVDFIVSDMDNVVDNRERQAIGIPINRRSYKPEDLTIVGDQVVEAKTLTPPEERRVVEEVEKSTGKRRLQRKDYKGRKPWQVLVEVYDEKHRAVMTRVELRDALVAAGFGEGTLSSALKSAIDKGHLRQLNNHRYSINDTHGKKLKTLGDLDAMKGNKDDGKRG